MIGLGTVFVCFCFFLLGHWLHGVIRVNFFNHNIAWCTGASYWVLLCITLIFLLWCVCVCVHVRARGGRACVCACLCVSDITDLSISWLVVNDHERFSLKQFHSWWWMVGKTVCKFTPMCHTPWTVSSSHCSGRCHNFLFDFARSAHQDTCLYFLAEEGVYFLLAFCVLFLCLRLVSPKQF